MVLEHFQGFVFRPVPRFLNTSRVLEHFQGSTPSFRLVLKILETLCSSFSSLFSALEILSACFSVHLSHGFHSEVWHSCAGGFELHCRLSAASWDWGTHSGGTCSLLLDYFYFDVYWSIMFFNWGIMWQLKLLFLRFRLPWVQLPSCWCGRRLRALTTPFGPVQRSWRIWSWVPGGLSGFFCFSFTI